MEHSEPEAQLEQTADALQGDLDRLGEHIADAEHKAAEAERVTATGDGVAGDVSGQEGGPMFGEDPSGAARDGADRRGTDSP
jgi:hypothetical protein